MKWEWPQVWSDEKGGWWRLLVTYVLFGGVFLILGAIVADAIINVGVVGAVKGKSVAVESGLRMGLLVFPLCLAGLGCLLGIRFIHRKPIHCVLTDGRPFGFGLFWRSAVVWTGLWLVGVVLFPGGLDELNQRYHEIKPSSWPGFCIAIFGVIFFQAAAEEIVDRGYLQTRVAAWVKRPWIAVLISSTLFTLLHTGEMTPSARVRIAAIGLTLGIALVRAGTTAPLIAMHTMSNSLGVLWLPERTNQTRNLLDAIYLCIQLTLWLTWLFWATKERTHNKVKIAVSG